MIRRRFDLQLLGEDRSEPATPRKRQKAREEGQVARSQDLGAAVVLVAGLLCIHMFFLWGFRELSGFLRGMISLVGSPRLHGELWPGEVILLGMKAFLLLWLPLAFGAFLMGLAAQVAQVGWKLSPKALHLKFDRLNPISGLKKIFALRSLVELLKGLLKALLLLYVLYRAFKNDLSALVETIHHALPLGAAQMGNAVWHLALKMALMLLVMAFFDYAYQRWEFERSLRMSKKEIKDEYKQMEGDPKVKQRIRQRQREMARQRMMQDVPKADVVVTNPTTYAVALQYDRAAMNAPTAVAKGRGVIARRIREIAEEHHVPIVENRPLARTLYDMVEVGEEIPEHLYKAVAEVLAFVYKLKGKG